MTRAFKVVLKDGTEKIVQASYHLVKYDMIEFLISEARSSRQVLSVPKADVAFIEEVAASNA